MRIRMPLRRVPLLTLLWIQWVSPVGSERQFEMGSVLAASGLLDDVGLEAVFVGAGHDNDEDNRHDSEIGSMSSLINIFGTGLKNYALATLRVPSIRTVKRARGKTRSLSLGRLNSASALSGATPMQWPTCRRTACHFTRPAAHREARSTHATCW